MVYGLVSGVLAVSALVSAKLAGIVCWQENRLRQVEQLLAELAPARETRSGSA
jgi:hypothetical protein